MSAQILIVDDDPMQRTLLQEMITRKLSYKCAQAENGKAAIDFLETEESKNINLIILDLNMPIMGGLETLDILKQTHPSIAVVVLSGSTNQDDTVQAIKKGAIDFLTKPYNSERLKTTINNAIKISSLSQEISRINNKNSGLLKFSDLIGYNSGLSNCIATARKAAQSDIQILITGETGTGKEVFARAIHGESLRAGKPFVAVNCGAIPSQLIESILFGHEKGAFTGAIDKSLGKFREADGGTIFLDEIGDLPMDAQVKLLRTLQQKEVEPVGASKNISINVRIISATNQDLELAVKEGRFREDLYFRLNVIRLALPPLRERTEDIQILSRFFLNSLCARENKAPKILSKNAVIFLNSYKWPGNVRQLENTIHRALILSDEDVIDVSDISHLINDHHNGCAPLLNSSTNTDQLSVLDSNGNLKNIEEIEREYIIFALKHVQGNITKAASSIGMAKSTFYKKMKHYDINERQY